VERNVAASLHEVRAPGDTGFDRFAAVLLRLHAVAVELEPFEVGLRDEVDDSGHGIRAVGGRRAAGDDVHALDQCRRDRVHVDGGGAVRRAHVSAAVHEHERARFTHAAQIEQVEARRADEAGRVLQRERRAELRQIVQEVTDVDVPGKLDRFFVDDGGRRRVSVPDIRAIRLPVTTISSLVVSSGSARSA